MRDIEFYVVRDGALVRVSRDHELVESFARKDFDSLDAIRIEILPRELKLSPCKVLPYEKKLVRDGGAESESDGRAESTTQEARQYQGVLPGLHQERKKSTAQHFPPYDT